jgi:Kef-type K+ transport system membrane component KefB
MFLFGLEMNIQYAMRNLRFVSLVACGGAVMGVIFGLSVSFYLYQELGIDGSPFYFCMIIMLVVSYTSSPMVIRLAT